MASVDPLSLPFASWQEGLFALADALSDRAREAVIVSRLEATAAKNGISQKEICTLALLVPSGARFDRQTLPKREPDPGAVAIAQKLGKSEAFNKHMEEILDAHDTIECMREKVVFAAFPERDPRRLLNDTIIGFAAAQLADVSRRPGEADPFLRLARRLSLWFKPSHDYSRYGIPLAADGTATIAAVRRFARSVAGNNEASTIGRLIAIWAGDVSVEASPEGIQEISSLLHPHVGGLYRVLGLEICGALAEEIDSLVSVSKLLESIESFGFKGGGLIREGAANVDA